MNTALPVPLETGRTNMKRAQKRLLDALDTCGTLQHQMVVLHKVMTTGDRAGIGLGLGLLDSHMTDERSMRKMVICIDDILHSDLVFGGSSNNSLDFKKPCFYYYHQPLQRRRLKMNYRTNMKCGCAI